MGTSIDNQGARIAEVMTAAFKLSTMLYLKYCFIYLRAELVLPLTQSLFLT